MTGPRKISQFIGLPPVTDTRRRTPWPARRWPGRYFRCSIFFALQNELGHVGDSKLGQGRSGREWKNRSRADRRRRHCPRFPGRGKVEPVRASLLCRAQFDRPRAVPRVRLSGPQLVAAPSLSDQGIHHTKAPKQSPEEGGASSFSIPQFSNTKNLLIDSPMVSPKGDRLHSYFWGFSCRCVF